MVVSGKGDTRGGRHHTELRYRGRPDRFEPSSDIAGKHSSQLSSPNYGRANSNCEPKSVPITVLCHIREEWKIYPSNLSKKGGKSLELHIPH